MILSVLQPNRVRNIKKANKSKQKRKVRYHEYEIDRLSNHVLKHDDMYSEHKLFEMKQELNKVKNGGYLRP